MNVNDHVNNVFCSLADECDITSSAGKNCLNVHRAPPRIVSNNNNIIKFEIVNFGYGSFRIIPVVT